MKRLFKNKWGITLLEGVIALGLLSLVAAASFGVLLSVSRKSARPDLQEEMLWAIERASEGLQLYNGYTASDIASWPNELRGLCGPDVTDADPLEVGRTHDIECMLPAICDPSNSSFSYQVANENFTNTIWSNLTSQMGEMVQNPVDYQQRMNVSFDIKCNGFTL